MDGACSPGSNTQVAQPAVNTPPNLELLPVYSADINGVVEVPRGWMYSLCSPGDVSTSKQPCEPGVDCMLND